MALQFRKQLVVYVKGQHLITIHDDMQDAHKNELEAWLNKYGQEESMRMRTEARMMANSWALDQRAQREQSAVVGPSANLLAAVKLSSARPIQEKPSNIPKSNLTAKPSGGTVQPMSTQGQPAKDGNQRKKSGATGMYRPVAEYSDK